MGWPRTVQTLCRCCASGRSTAAPWKGHTGGGGAARSCAAGTLSSHQQLRECSSSATRSAAQGVVIGSILRSNAGRGTQSKVMSR